MNFLLVAWFLFFIKNMIFTNQYSDAVYASIPDIYNPTLVDYQAIEDYIHTGVYPYIGRVINWEVEQRPRDLKLTPRPGESLRYRIRAVNLNNPNKRRNCIILYTSFNDDSPTKLRQLFRQIRNSNFKGHVIYRVGGWPNIEAGNLIYAHLPNSYIMCAFAEALRLGFRRVLWLNPNVRAEIRYRKIFKKIKQASFFAYSLPYKLSQLLQRKEYILSFNISENRASKIYTLFSGIIGLDFTDSTALNLFLDWQKLIKSSDMPSLTPYRSASSLSYVASNYYDKSHFPLFYDHVDTPNSTGAQDLEFTIN